MSCVISLFGPERAPIERFRRVDRDTVRDELTWMIPRHGWAPWTVALDLTSQPAGMFEYACHEGNDTMQNMLGAVRAEEAAAAPATGR